MKVILGSCGLLALFLVYSSRPSPSLDPLSPQATGRSGGATKSHKAHQNTGSPIKNVSAEDWEAVGSIASKYREELTGIEDTILALKRSEFYRPQSGSMELAPGLIEKRFDLEHSLYEAEMAIRDSERKQWREMSAYLSPYELRKYRMENSYLGRNLREETKELKPTKAEFLALFTREEGLQDFLDLRFNGDLDEMNQTLIEGGGIRGRIMTDSSLEMPEKMAALDDAGDPAYALWLEHMDILQRTPPIAHDRLLEHVVGARPEPVDGESSETFDRNSGI